MEGFGNRLSSRKCRWISFINTMVLPNDIDLLNPSAELEKKKQKLKRLVQSPNSFSMDVKCQGCFKSLQDSCSVWELPD
nr:40S ribosomal protein S27-2 [Ipomoea batatas]